MGFGKVSAPAPPPPEPVPNKSESDIEAKNDLRLKRNNRFSLDKTVQTNTLGGTNQQQNGLRRTLG